MRLSQINHRSAMEHLKNCSRTAHGRSTVFVRSRDACRAGASVFVGCSFCVRSLPVWRSSCVGSCGVRARRQIARRLTGGKPKTADCGSKAQGGGHYTGTPRAYYRLHTDGRRAGIGQTWTNPAIPRWAETARRHFTRRVEDNAPYHGLLTGGTRTAVTRDA